MNLVELKPKHAPAAETVKEQMLEIVKNLKASIEGGTCLGLMLLVKERTEDGADTFYGYYNAGLSVQDMLISCQLHSHRLLHEHIQKDI